MIPAKLIERVLAELRNRGVRIVRPRRRRPWMHLAGKGAKEVEKDEKAMAASKAPATHTSKIKERRSTEEDPNPSRPPRRRRTRGRGRSGKPKRECSAMVSVKMTPDDAKTLCNQVGASAAKGVPGKNPCPYRGDRPR